MLHIKARMSSSTSVFVQVREHIERLHEADKALMEYCLANTEAVDYDIEVEEVPNGVYTAFLRNDKYSSLKQNFNSAYQSLYNLTGNECSLRDDHPLFKGRYRVAKRKHRYVYLCYAAYIGALQELVSNNIRSTTLSYNAAWIECDEVLSRSEAL